MSAVNLNKELFRKHVSEGNKPVLVEFWAPWCVYCRRIAPAFDKIAEQYADTLVSGKLNIDEVPELAEREHIEVIPTLILYKDGQAVDFITAPDSKAKIEAFINQHLNK
ncbi:MAG: thioredoxin [Clostridiales bacterium]|nr:thioredoxin [Clostridiales bacterium]